MRDSLTEVEEYGVGTTTYALFRQDQWPSVAVLHMDVRSGPVDHADAVVVLGIAGGDVTAGSGAEEVVQAVLDQPDDRGVCIVRGWLGGERDVAALPIECPDAIRDELDGILGEFDDVTGGDAIWVLRFQQGLLRGKKRL